MGNSFPLISTEGCVDVEWVYNYSVGDRGKKQPGVLIVNDLPHTTIVPEDYLKTKFSSPHKEAT
jgi:hypothetical protein